MKTFLLTASICLAAISCFAQQRRLISKEGYAAADGYYIPFDPTLDSVATEFTYLNPDSTITIELRSVSGNTLLRRDEYKRKKPVGTWIQQYDPAKPALKTVYDIDDEGVLASCPVGYIYELGTSSLSFGGMGHNFAPPVLAGEKSPSEFLRVNLRYPNSARESGVHGKVRIKGTLTETGELTDLAISRSVDRDLDAEVFRIVKMMRFKGPALVDGKPARLCVSLPVSFELE
jgi:TonB family protein